MKLPDLDIGSAKVGRSEYFLANKPEKCWEMPQKCRKCHAKVHSFSFIFGGLWYLVPSFKNDDSSSHTRRWVNCSSKWTRRLEPDVGGSCTWKWEQRVLRGVGSALWKGCHADVKLKLFAKRALEWIASTRTWKKHLMPWPCSTQGRNPGKIVTFLPFMIPIPKGDSSDPLLSRVSLIPSWANSLHFNNSRHCSLIVRRLFFGLQQKPVLCCMTLRSYQHTPGTYPDPPPKIQRF